MHFRPLWVAEDPDNVLGLFHSAARSMTAFRERTLEAERRRREEEEDHRRTQRQRKLRRRGYLPAREAREHARSGARGESRSGAKSVVSPAALARRWFEEARGGSFAERRLAGVPPAYRVGVMKTGRPEALDATSFSVRGDRARVSGLGTLKLARDTRARPLRYRIGLDCQGWPDGTLLFAYPGRGPRFKGADHPNGSLNGLPNGSLNKGAAGDLAFEDVRRAALAGAGPSGRVPRNASPVEELRRDSRSLDFLVKREGYSGQATLRRAAALDYIHANPHLTLQEIKALGFTSQTDLETLADSIAAIQDLMSQTHKSRDNDIISPRQWRRIYEEHEAFMPEGLDGYDDSDQSRPVKGQAFENQMYKAIYCRPEREFFA